MANEFTDVFEPRFELCHRLLQNMVAIATYLFADTLQFADSS